MAAIIAPVPRQRSYVFGNRAPQPPLYGVWIVDKMQINGVERQPLVTDYERWRRVVVQSFGNQVFMAFWRMDDPFFSDARAHRFEQQNDHDLSGTGCAGEGRWLLMLSQPITRCARRWSPRKRYTAIRWRS
jgi:hypothetical protein